MATTSALRSSPGTDPLWALSKVPARSHILTASRRGVFQLARARKRTNTFSLSAVVLSFKVAKCAIASSRET